MRHPTPADRLLATAGAALRTLSNAERASRPCPQAKAAPVPAGDGSSLIVTGVTPLNDDERREAGALMRVNHVGEVCAQALYRAQSLGTGDAGLRRHLDTAAQEEADHLAWTQQRLDELGARPSRLNPLWYAGAFTIGWLASRAGTATSLGFVVETERQVERHLQRHLDRLSPNDTASRAIVLQMQADEASHAEAALRAGARTLSAPARWAMRAAAKVMTTVAHRI